MADAISPVNPFDPSKEGTRPPREADRLSSFSTLVKQMKVALLRLETESSLLRIPPLAGRDWYDLLTRKLLPQLTDNAYLIVAVVGGTNIGKSVIFNHIAGFRASSSSPLASGTKHPVCLVPSGFDSEHDLPALFPTFELHQWATSDEALASHAEHCLYWRSNNEVPPNLIILDTPDVDSDAPVNWQRADAIRQSADVLVAVLTQQKYNDAAVKQFFRKAANEDKAALVVFNRVELPDDEPYWPLWLQTFCGETGLRPEFVYLAPNDRKSAEAIELKFEERKWPHESSNGATSNDSESIDVTADGVQLREVLSQLRFAEIKLRTLRGSLKKFASESDGVPSYLREIQGKSQQFDDAAKIFASRGLIRQTNWPAAPNALLVDEMWTWWANHREAWTSKIHGFYASVGHWVGSGFKLIRNQIWEASPPPLDEYKRAEWDAIVRVLEQVYEQLRVITTLGNELLTNRLERLLSGSTCESVLEKLRQEHEAFDFELLARTLVETELTIARDNHTDLFELLRNADRAAAVVRPALTMLLAVGGGLGAEDLLLNAGSQWVTHVAIDATAAASTTVAGEAVVESASGMLGQAKAWLLKLHEKFKVQREAWLIAKLKEHLLGELLTELQQGATVAKSSAYEEVKSLTRQFSESLTKT